MLHRSILVCLVLSGCGSPSSDDTTVDDSGPDAAEVDGYVQRCDSLFSARVVEKQAEANPAAALDCEAPLLADIGTIGGGPLCRAGETPNACRQRLYATPPPARTLRTGCTGAGCMRSVWLPRCADGTDTCAEPEAICQDGTRPMALVSPATPPSNRWIIYTSGEGGPCVGELCWAMYRYSRTNNDQIFEESMSSAHPDYQAIGGRAGAGITSAAATSPLRGWNRIELKRCADPASDGAARVPVGDGVASAWAAVYPSAPVETRHSLVPVWYRGFSIHSALLHALATTAGRDLDADGTPDLPSFGAASQVVFAGSSDAAAYYVMAADALAQIARSISPSVDARLLVDAKFDPSIDSEGRFVAGAPADFSLYTSPYHVTRACGPLPDNQDGVGNETCSDRSWLPGPSLDGAPTWRDNFAGRGSQHDASCTALHGDAAPCFNDQHVIANHLQLPVFVLADQEDPVISDKSAMADHAGYTWPSIGEFRKRVLAQGHDLERHWPQREEAAPAANLTMLLRKQRRAGQAAAVASHTHLGQDERMFRWSMSLCASANGTPQVTRSTAETIAAWLDDALPDHFLIEDAAAATSPFWVTGTSCRAPE